MKKKLFSAVILSGGKSTRMGFDKQLLNIEGKSLIESNIIKLSKIFDEIILVTNKPELYDTPNIKVVSDIYSNCGPLGGIHAGLHGLSDESQYAYLLACDMPCISTKFIEYLMEQMVNNNYDTCVSTCNGKMQPFNSIYNKDILPIIESDLEQNKTSLYKLVNNVNTLHIPEETIVKFSEGKEMFINLNTIEDLRKYADNCSRK